MTDYLDRLEAELVRAGFHQRRRPPVAPALAVIAVALVASWSQFRPQGDERERSATPPDTEVQATFDGMMTSSPPPSLRVGFTAGEPLTYLVEVGSAAASGRVLLGQKYVDLDLPVTVAPITVTLTDDDGNERTKTYDIEPVLALKESFEVLRGDTIPVEDTYPLLSTGIGPGAAAYEVGRMPGASANVGVGDSRICVGVLLPADGGNVACWPINDELLQGRLNVDRGIAIALVPDGTTDAQAVYPDGRTEPVEIVDNVIVAAGADRIEWRLP